MTSDAKQNNDDNVMVESDATADSSIANSSWDGQQAEQPSTVSSSTTPVAIETEGSLPISPSKEEDENEEEVTRSKEEIEEEEREMAEAEKKRLEELKKKYADWPLRGIKDPHPNDVMYGRGGGTNHHPGNKLYRKMVEDRKLEYVNSKRLDKPLVALEIIRLWRAQLPPGRFLKLDEKTGLWSDVGDKKAREKTSQALREKAPLLRKQQEGDDMDDDEGEKSEEEEKTTRFAEGTKGDAPSVKVKKALLARDHSLGREFLASGEAVTLDGFSWQDPFKPSASSTRPADATVTHPAPSHPAPPGNSARFMPAGRNSSSGSLGMAPPYHHTSVGGPPPPHSQSDFPPPPPPPDFYGRMASGDQRREFSNSSLGSWGAPYPYPPPAPMEVHGMHQRSGSWTHPLPPDSPYHAPHHQRAGSWGGGRENSLSWNPLIGASISRPADRDAFENSGRGGSGYWGEPVSPRSQYSIPPPPPPPASYDGVPYMSSGSMGLPPPYGAYRNPSPPTSDTPSPPTYEVDLNIARSWSGGGEVRRTWSGEYPPHASDMGMPLPYDGQPRPVAGADTIPPRGGSHHYGMNGGIVPRPTIVKRDTSNQNESYETKTSIKRAALNRDQSATSNRLKQEYMPDYYNTQFDTEREMQTLQETTEQIRLSPGPRPRPAVEPSKPHGLGQEDRVTTMDVITRELLSKPTPLLDEHRTSTLALLDLDLDGSDSMIRTEELIDESTRRTGSSFSSLPKPAYLAPEDRLTTQDFLELVSAPLETVEDKLGDDDEPLPLIQERKWVTRA